MVTHEIATNQTLDNEVLDMYAWLQQLKNDNRNFRLDISGEQHELGSQRNYIKRAYGGHTPQQKQSLHSGFRQGETMGNGIQMWC